MAITKNKWYMNWWIWVIICFICFSLGIFLGNIYDGFMNTETCNTHPQKQRSYLLQYIDGGHELGNETERMERIERLLEDLDSKTIQDQNSILYITNAIKGDEYYQKHITRFQIMEGVNAIIPDEARGTKSINYAEMAEIYLELWEEGYNFTDDKIFEKYQRLLEDLDAKTIHDQPQIRFLTEAIIKEENCGVYITRLELMEGVNASIPDEARGTDTIDYAEMATMYIELLRE